MAAQATNLFLLEDLEDSARTKDLADRDLSALRSVAEWIKTYVVKPHKDLGRPGTVCPVVPGSLERKVLWLAPEQIADRGEPDAIDLVSGYKRLFLEIQPTGGDDADYKVIVVVFTDLPTDRAQRVFDNVQEQLAVASYADNGILFGPYYEGNETTAIYNSSFRPFESPVPFLFVRPTVVADWKFFLDSNEELLNLWARHFGESATKALGGTTPLAVEREARLIRETRRTRRQPLTARR